VTPRRHIGGHDRGRGQAVGENSYRRGNFHERPSVCRVSARAALKMSVSKTKFEQLLSFFNVFNVILDLAWGMPHFLLNKRKQASL
jgi:hypothetical protein